MIDRICELSGRQKKVDLITEQYSEGRPILEGMPASKIASVLNVDIEGFSDDGWEFTTEPLHEPDIDDLDQEDAESIVWHLWDQTNAVPRVSQARFSELEECAEKLNSDGPITGKEAVKLLGLTEEEVASAVSGIRENILLGDVGWRHCAQLTLTGKNGWKIIIRVLYDDVDREESWDMSPSSN